MTVLKRGERLDLGNGACQRIWVITSGVAAICTGLADGRRQIVGLETPGEIICGLAAASGSESWLEALSECHICEQSLAGLHGPLDQHPDLVSALFVLIHARLETCSTHLVTLGRLDSMERVSLFLLDMSRRIGQPAGASVQVELPMTREDIADFLGLNSETVSRLFTRLRKSGLVKFQSRSAYYIPDIAALERRIPMQSRAPHSFQTHAPRAAGDQSFPRGALQ
ncbi:Crp/Fnr family transcriptional regulator [Actibacterium sp. D379-3]